LLVFAHACKMGVEGIVSKRKDSRYRSGRSPHWIKSKNPRATAVKRKARLAAMAQRARPWNKAGPNYLPGPPN
jgi:ATP-dependent DNA ligase